MKLGLRHKILLTNLTVLILTFTVISIVVLGGISRLNTGMLIDNLIHQADISVISIRQSLFTGGSSGSWADEFKTRAGDFSLRLAGETGMRVLIFSREKQLLSDSGGAGPDTASFGELDEVLNGNRAYVIRQSPEGRKLFFSFPIIREGSAIGEVMFVYPMSEIDKGTRDISLLLLSSFAAGLLIILAVGTYLSFRITRPVLKLKDAVKELAAGNYEARIPVSSSDEVGELAGAFNDMSGKIGSTVEAIREEKEKLNSVLESMGEGVIALDGGDRIIAINKRAEAVLDGVRRELGGITARVRESRARVIEEIGSSEKYMLVCATPMTLNKSSEGIVMILNDITELRRLQEKQRLFMTNISHELKTPLTTIIGYTGLLEENGADPGVFSTSVHHLRDASDRLLRMINDLIDLSSLSRSEFAIEPRSVDISALVRDITAQMSLKARKFNIAITADIPSLPEIIADPVRLKQVVVNILDNSIKYSPNGEVSVVLRQEEHAVCLEIADTGCGIPSEVLDRIFEPFFRVDRARSRKLGGNGLGLSIVKEIVDKHGGKIEIESAEGKGTKVRIKLPPQGGRI
jgi:signal transduction histidine kinase